MIKIPPSLRLPLAVDTIKNEGDYGEGDDGHRGFTSYVIRDADGKAIFDTLNSDDAEVHEEFDEDGRSAWDEPGRQRAAAIVAIVNAAGGKPTHRHYKGGLVRVICEGTWESTGEPIVIYEHDGKVWARSRDVFHGVRDKRTGIWYPASADMPVSEHFERRFAPIVDLAGARVVSVSEPEPGAVSVGFERKP